MGHRKENAKENPHLEERELSKQWVEKINAHPTEELTCGDTVYYVDHQAKGYNRWRTGLIL